MIRWCIALGLRFFFSLDQELVYTDVVLSFLSDVPVSGCCKTKYESYVWCEKIYMMFWRKFFGEAFAVWGFYEMLLSFCGLLL